MASTSYLLSLVCLVIILGGINEASGQRNLLHWKRDLEYRINLYQDQRQTIENIVASSVYSEAPEPLQSHGRVVLRGNVRFTDLIIPDGSLLLDRHIAQHAVNILNNKTQSFVSSKMIKLAQIGQELGDIRSRIGGPGQQFIDKGVYNMPPSPPQYVRGPRFLKQFIQGHIIESDRVELSSINFTSVNRVVDEAYRVNMKFGTVDSQNRLFFEGRKTFWRAVFMKPLKSGCCDRLRPLHTNRMMIRSASQVISAPVMFQTSEHVVGESVLIRHLSTNYACNQKLMYGYSPNYPDMLVKSARENIIHPNDLVNLKQQLPLDPNKVLVFTSTFRADEVTLSPTMPDNRLIIGIESEPTVRLDVGGRDYLLRYQMSRENVTQRVHGRFYIDGATIFAMGLESHQLNGPLNFHQFASAGVVRVDRPSNITGPIMFSALPSYISNLPPIHSVQIMQVSRHLDVGLLNGMNIHKDVLFTPIPENQVIRLRGDKVFENYVHMDGHLFVKQLVNRMKMPEEVIPLHLNDFVDTVWPSNLWFMDGIQVKLLTVESRQFDEINFHDIGNGDAKSLMLNSLMTKQTDGTYLIRAPMRIKNLILRGSAPNSGLLNGVRPEGIMELNTNRQFDTIYGKKTFLAPVEATDCTISDINNLANWTNHLVRIDRPNLVESVQTKLAFMPTLPILRTTDQKTLPGAPSSVHIDRLGVEFYPGSDRSSYLQNLNFSPELFALQQALMRGMDNHTGGRYRVTGQVQLMNPSRSLINGVALDDIVTLDQPFKFDSRFVMVGKVEVTETLRANRITSTYPVDAMDLVQFEQYRVPISGFGPPVRLHSLVLSANNMARYVRSRQLNGVPFDQFANSIMSLTRPQDVYSSLVFTKPVDIVGIAHTYSSLNGIHHFNRFMENLSTANYSFEDGLQCNSVIIKG